MHITVITRALSDTEVCVECPECGAHFWGDPRVPGFGDLPVDVRVCPDCLAVSPPSGDVLWAGVIDGKSDTLGLPPEFAGQFAPYEVRGVRPVVGEDFKDLLLLDDGEMVRAFRGDTLAEVAYSEIKLRGKPWSEVYW